MDPNPPPTRHPLMTTYEARYKALLRRVTEISDMRPRPAAKALAAVVYAHNKDT